MSARLRPAAARFGPLLAMGFAAASIAPFGPVRPAAQELDCTDPSNQTELTECAARDFQAADGELNELWPSLVDQVKAIDEFESEELRGAEAALREAQRGWIQMRDGHCTVEGFQARGGTLEPMIVFGCKARLTRRRIEELRTLMQDLGTQ